MFTNGTPKLLSLCLLLTVLVLTACQKDPGVDLDNPPPIPEEVKDSTLLVKSIMMIYHDLNDTIVETYDYDTVHKKITLSWTDNLFDPAIPDVQSELNNSSADFSYNNKGLVSRVAYHYPANYTPWDFDYNTIDVAYDEANVLKKMTTKYMNGTVKEHAFTKTMTAGGNYALAWEYIDTDSPDSILRKVEFDKDANAITNYIEYYHSSSPGDPMQLSTVLDSLAYNADGSVEKIFRKVDNPGTDQDSDYTFYEFAGRQTKGNQLYNQRQVLLNGIANMPFGDLDVTGMDGFGVLSFVMDYEYMQYSKYPAQTAKARIWNGTVQNFTFASELDDKGRLVKFTGFVYDDDLEPLEFKISYYK